jgi:prophage tail gpP-like protein
MLVDTDLTFIGFEKGEYLISEVTFSQSVSSGTTTTLSLVRADAYSIKEPRVEKDINKNGSGWKKDKFGAAFKEVAKSLGL